MTRASRPARVWRWSVSLVLTGLTLIGFGSYSRDQLAMELGGLVESYGMLLVGLWLVDWKRR